MTFVSQFNYKADILMYKLSRSADGKTIVHLFKEINHAALDAIAQVSIILNLKLKNLIKYLYNCRFLFILDWFRNEY